MDGEQGAGIIWGIGALVLVGSAFLARRIPMAQAARMALAWIAIFAVGLAIYAYRDEFAAVGGRIWSEVTGDARTVEEGGELRIRKSADGHFWVTVTINGNEEPFLIDSGASITGLSAGAATRSDVVPSEGYPMILQTANGPVAADRATIGTLQLGPIRRENLSAVVAEEFGGTNVLGMNFLSTLSSWRVEGDWLVLRP